MCSLYSDRIVGFGLKVSSPNSVPCRQIGRNSGGTKGMAAVEKLLDRPRVRHARVADAGGKEWLWAATQMHSVCSYSSHQPWWGR
jgi:hypothetical protein